MLEKRAEDVLPSHASKQSAAAPSPHVHGSCQFVRSRARGVLLCSVPPSSGVMEKQGRTGGVVRWVHGSHSWIEANGGAAAGPIYCDRGGGTDRQSQLLLPPDASPSLEQSKLNFLLRRVWAKFRVLQFVAIN
jgi:hypothetical protein